MRFCFVILHYNTIEETRECVKSIKELNEKKVKIIIVDNASRNGTGEVLKEEYKNDKGIDVLMNSSNEGFARGNNLGYRYAKEKYHPEFIIVTNNDVIFFQKEFTNLLEKEYEKNSFYILGPDVLDITKTKHHSPINDAGPTLYWAKFWLKCFKKYLFRARIKNFLQNTGLLNISRRVLNKKEFIEEEKNFVMEETAYREGVVVHGCCIIASRLFIEKQDWIFYPKTFLFNEEYILWEWCKYYNYCITYSPDLKIIHNEHASLGTVGHNYKRQVFTWKNQVKSLKILIEVKKQLGEKCKLDKIAEK